MTILIVEDEFVTRTALAALLSFSGFKTHAVESAEKAMTLLDEGHVPEVALVDLDLPGMDGAEFISRLMQRGSSIFPVLITAASDDRVAKLLDPHINHLRKPVDFKHLLHLIHRRVQAH